MTTRLAPFLVPHPHVTRDTATGSPIVVGSRVPVRRLWAWHRGGATVETLVKRYPNLGPARILDALAFAYDNMGIVEADIERGQAIERRSITTARAPSDLFEGGPIVQRGRRPL